MEFKTDIREVIDGSESENTTESVSKAKKLSRRTADITKKKKNGRNIVLFFKKGNRAEEEPFVPRKSLARSPVERGKEEEYSVSEVEALSEHYVSSCYSTPMASGNKKQK
jgi:hypothetical protein